MPREFPSWIEIDSGTASPSPSFEIEYIISHHHRLPTVGYANDLGMLSNLIAIAKFRLDLAWADNNGDSGSILLERIQLIRKQLESLGHWVYYSESGYRSEHPANAKRATKAVAI